MAELRRQKVPSSNIKLGNPLARALNKAKHSGFYHDLRLRGKHPLRLLGTPKNIWQGSVTAGTQIVSGRIIVAGHVLENPEDNGDIWSGEQIWQSQDLDDRCLEYLHSFVWLRDVNQAVDREVAQARAEELIETWIDHHTNWGEISWRPDIVSQRIINWLVYAPLIMDSDDIVYRGRVLDILARSARHLYKLSSDLPDGPDGLLVVMALIISGLYIPFGDEWLSEGLGLLKFVLGKEVLVDGGVRSRNPHDTLQLFMMASLLKVSLKDRNLKAPEELISATKRMATNLRSMVHADGKLALFNGSYIQNNEDVFSILLKLPDHKSSESGPLNDMEQSGFRRIANGDTFIIQDVGPPAELELSRSSHCGALSFEMSRGKERFIVNCGNAAFAGQALGEDIYSMSRSSSAHSTLTLADVSSSEVRDDGLIGCGITKTTCERISERGHVLLDSSHDGYCDRYGFVHKRLIYMNDKGADIRGEDILERENGRVKNNHQKYDIRFHLHPNVSATLNKKADGVKLTLVNGEVWNFRYKGAELSVEQSLYFGNAGKTAQCKQIVLSGMTDGDLTTVLWSFNLDESSTK